LRWTTARSLTGVPTKHKSENSRSLCIVRSSSFSIWRRSASSSSTAAEAAAADAAWNTSVVAWMVITSPGCSVRRPVILAWLT